LLWSAEKRIVLDRGDKGSKMTDAMAAMLDELMGKTRNANKEEQGKKMAFNDPDVCQYALAGLCPYTLFSNTKSDLGAFLRIPSIAAHQVISTLS
jgi:hypothetical protein